MLEGEYQIIRRAKKGGSEDFGLLYDHYVPQIYRFVLLKVSHKHEAEDLTHEIFLSAWKNIDSYKYRGLPFSSWLYQIARNRVIDYYRTKKEQLSIENVNENEFRIVDNTEQNLDQQVALNKIRQALPQLKEDQQQIIILRFIEDLSPAEISEIMDKSEGAIRLIQHRAIKKLKEIFE